MRGADVSARTLLAGLLLFSASLAACESAEAFRGPARSIAIQHHGRVKPFEAFSRDLVQTVTGKTRWERRSPVLTVLDAIADPEALRSKVWILGGRPELLETLGLPAGQRHFSYGELSGSFDRIEALVRESGAKRDRDERPSLVEQQAEALFTRIHTVKQILSGESLTVVPAESAQGAWLTLKTADTETRARFERLLQAYRDKNAAAFKAAADEWEGFVSQSTGSRYRTAIRLELFYWSLRPFEWAAGLYLFAFVCLGFLAAGARGHGLGWNAAGLAIGFHTLGLVIRSIVLGRPPVSNMYESMIFAGWVLFILALLFSRLHRSDAIAAAGSAVGALVVIYADLLPIDAGLDVLVPVLRSNYWLTVHVLTIVASYGAFGLATALGHRQLYLDAAGRLGSREREDQAAAIERIIQAGVLLLGAGTVLGGVWANESWGRFWGWDPKETWALITFLGYLVVVHLRHAKRMDATWTAVSAVTGFLLVLMTWYGVNFVLGRGLHSYGQGQGGGEWITGFVVFEIVFLAVVFLKLKNPLAGPKR